MISYEQVVGAGALEAYFCSETTTELPVVCGGEGDAEAFQIAAGVVVNAHEWEISLKSHSYFLENCHSVARRVAAPVLVGADDSSLKSWSSICTVIESNLASTYVGSEIYSGCINHSAYLSGMVGSSELDTPSVQAKMHLKKMLSFERNYSRRKALDYMYSFLEDAFSDKDLNMIDEALCHASEQLVGSSLSVSFLRATSRAKGKLYFWNYYYAKVKSGLADGADAARVLRGL